MRKPTITMNANASLTSLGYMGPSGMIEIGGGFGGGTLTLFLSLSGGTVKNAVTDDSGTAYSITAGDTFIFDLPINDDQGIGVIFYATLAGSTSPSITITPIDNA